MTEPQLRVTFVMEQHLGHRTFYENLRRAVDGRRDIRARWVPVTYDPGNALWEHLPGLSARTRGALRGRGEVRAACRGKPPDIRFFNTQVPAVLGGRLARTRPYVLCTDVTPVQYDRMARQYGHTADAANPVSNYKRRLNTSVFQGARHNVAWSTWVAHSLQRDYGVDPQCIDVIPPGVDTARWSVATGRQDGHPVRLLFVGGDFVRKGGEVLLHAFAQLPPGSAELVVVTKTRLTRIPHVRVHNDLVANSSALRSVFASCDVFVMPSNGETFGIAAVEASASGLPVVATRMGGLEDIVEDGQTGFLVNPGDRAALVQRLHSLIDDPRLRRRLGAAGLRRVVAHFDADVNARRVIEILRRPDGREPIQRNSKAY